MKAKVTIKPRNPFVQHLVNKKQGAFKSKKPTRSETKVSLRKGDYSDKLVIYPNSLYGPIAELV